MSQLYQISVKHFIQARALL